MKAKHLFPALFLAALVAAPMGTANAQVPTVPATEITTSTQGSVIFLTAEVDPGATSMAKIAIRFPASLRIADMRKVIVVTSTANLRRTGNKDQVVAATLADLQADRAVVNVRRVDDPQGLYHAFGIQLAVYQWN